MPGPITCEFDVELNRIKFETVANGDRITIRGIHLGSEQASNLAHLINNGQVLHVTARAKGEE